MNVIQLKEDKFREALRLSEYAFQYKVDEERLQQQLTKMKESHEIYGIMEGRLSCKTTPHSVSYLHR